MAREPAPKLMMSSSSTLPSTISPPTSAIGERPVKYPFWFGGSSSCLAACGTHPFDLGESPYATFQVRMQTRKHPEAPRSMMATFAYILRHERIPGLYNGLPASLVRQMTYSTTRFGMYESLKSNLSPHGTPMTHLLAIASISGFVGGIVGNPADVLNVRMQHDTALPLSERRNYRSALDGLLRMRREEGWKSLYKGVWPNSLRAMLMTASQLASYDGFKQALMEHTPLEDSLTTHFSASLLAGFVATTVCSPIDVIKTRVMSSSTNRSFLQQLLDICRNEGIGWALRGWVPSFIRLGPQTIFTFLFLEQHKRIYKQVIS
ncbi:Bgt-3257 [Blumeria graminis f. sp. tritici]|uniref:Bgt-3257 n=1 Tax=Blumeria graminis f. sp. tritici TaxID=62690 RepID=A0A9X9MM13_BLUGR|nr:Mitochondrial dicarboxylate carrier [Blumeria graminis f. sp. tritici 96224]VDB93032.1 Bgt-3257 [Blumeria graminis f. sp. tritici]